jgi:hypothetical protein
VDLGTLGTTVRYSRMGTIALCLAIFVCLSFSG